MVDYDNGELEKRVHKSLIRERGAGGENNKDSQDGNSNGYNTEDEIARRREDPDAPWQSNPHKRQFNK